MSVPGAPGTTGRIHWGLLITHADSQAQIWSSPGDPDTGDPQPYLGIADLMYSRKALLSAKKYCLHMKDHPGTRTYETGEGPSHQKTEPNCLRTLALELQCLGLDLISAADWLCYLRSLRLRFPPVTMDMIMTVLGVMRMREGNPRKALSRVTGPLSMRHKCWLLLSWH